MRVTPITEEEAAESAKPKFLLKPGLCDFDVIKAEDQKSEAGNEMIKLTLECYDQDNKKAIVFDYLLDVIPHKVRHFAYATGLGHLYESGELQAANCEGKGGQLLIRNKEQKGYAPKNDVADYVISDRTKESAGYKQAKAADNGSAPKESARNKAWKAFCAKTTTFDGEARASAFRTSLDQFFGHSDQGKLNDNDWQTYNAVLPRWHPVNGFPQNMRKPKQAENPVSSEPIFDEADIPF